MPDASNPDDQPADQPGDEAVDLDGDADHPVDPPATVDPAIPTAQAATQQAAHSGHDNAGSAIAPDQQPGPAPPASDPANGPQQGGGSTTPDSPPAKAASSGGRDSANDKPTTPDEYDISQEPVGRDTGALTPREVPYDPAPTRERVRSASALLLIACLAFTIVASFVTVWTHGASGDDLSRLLTGVLAPVVGVVGAVTGFYFGSGGSGPNRS